MGSPWALLAGVLTVLAQAASGRFFRFSDTSQLVISTGTTVVTFLFVFLIQDTQRSATGSPRRTSCGASCGTWWATRGMTRRSERPVKSPA
jgi:hypothetical protein